MADKRDFENQALPHMDAVYRTALALSRNADQAEDLTQTTMLKAWAQFDSFRPDTNCRAWLLRILRNAWVDHLRRRKSPDEALPLNEALVARPDQPNETQWSDANDLLNNFSDEPVIRALADLDEDRRLTLFLVDVERLSHEEVAEITGVPVGTVKSRSWRARVELREKLRAYARDRGLAKPKA